MLSLTTPLLNTGVRNRTANPVLGRNRVVIPYLVVSLKPITSARQCHGLHHSNLMILHAKRDLPLVADRRASP